MSNGWTGGQYSLARVALAFYLLVHFAMLAPYGAEVFSSSGVLADARTSPFSSLFPSVLSWVDSPAAVVALLAVGMLGAVALGMGWHDRVAALAIAYVWACLHARNPLIANPSLPYVGWLLVAHACMPPAPFGSWAARGRVDPGGGWRFPPGIFAAAWIAMAVGYSYSGATKLVSPSWLDGSALERVLSNPLARPGLARELLASMPSDLLRAATFGALAMELAFAPLALFSRLRPWIWLGAVGMHVSLVALIDFADLSAGMLCLHLFTFDPAWIAPRAAGARLRVYYDGECGLCHRFVRFALAEGRDREGLRFAPLQGETFARRVDAAARARLPDSVIVEDERGELATRSEAVLRVCDHLGGLWRAIAIAARAVPRPARDALYERIAAVRKRLFAAPKAACPLMPRELGARFDP